jgi:hypothetical protein
MNESLVSKANSDVLDRDLIPMTTVHTSASLAVQGSNIPNPQRMLNTTAANVQSHNINAIAASSDATGSAPTPGAISLRGEIFHVFISYRVKTESDLVGELYHQLMTSAKAAKLPDISRWPSSFKKPTNDVASSRIHVFWDAKCLAPGLTWKDNGFVSALGKSLVFAPMLSDGVVEKWNSPVVDYVDNVLLELILALEFNRLNSPGDQPSSVHPCKYIVPVFVNELFRRQNSLSKDVARDTMTEAARLLSKYGLRPSCDYSPHSVFTALSAFQGVQMFLYDKKLKQQAIGAVVQELITAVTMCIQQSSFFLDDFKAHHPRARELCDWLHTHNMSRYTGIIARHGITSVYALSVLDIGSAVPILAEDCALSCGESRMQAIVSLSRAVAISKSSELSLPLSARFNRFVDSDASALSALFSSCGVDTGLSKFPILIFALFASVVSVNAGIFVLNILDQPFLSVSIVVNPVFWFILAAILFLTALWPFAFGGSISRVPSTEFKPRLILVSALLLVPCVGTIIIVYIKAVHFESIAFSHSILCQAALERGVLTVSFDACYLYELFGIHLVQCIGFFTVAALVYAKQELALRAGILAVISAFSLFFGFIEIVTFPNLQSMRTVCSAVLAVCAAAFILFEGLRVFSQNEAAKALRDAEAQYTKMWHDLVSDSNCGQSTVEDLYKYMTHAFEKVLEDPNAASTMFRLQPRVLQEHSSVDNLFDDVELVDIAFQELVNCWLKVRLVAAAFLVVCMSYLWQGSDDAELSRLVFVREKEDLDAFKIDLPETFVKGLSAVIVPGPVKQVTRAISKTVRSYRGNFRRLTDLVRTTIVFSTFTDILIFLQALSKKSISSPLPIASLWQLAQSEDQAPTQELSSADSDKFNDRRNGIMLQILRIRNRFDPSPEYKKHLFGGYRDISLKVKMAFVCQRPNSVADRVKFVPMSRWCEPDTKRLVFEIQLHHHAMQLGSDKEKQHRNYVKSRDLINA